MQRTVRALAVGLVAVCALGACSSGSSSQDVVDYQRPATGPQPASNGVATPSSASTTTATPGATTAAVAPAAVIVAAPESAERAIEPTEPVTVAVQNGTLTSVKLVNPAGRLVRGSFAADRTSWRSSEILGYDRVYRLSATGANADGAVTTKATTVTTVAPANLTMPSITDVYGTSLADTVYGVGMVVRVHFDEPVKRRAAESTLNVATTPKVVGGWYWRDDQNVFWRPRSYYPSGTTVKVSADVFGHRLGDGLYGQADQSASFRIGAKHVSIASPKTHQVRVYFNDKFQRSMPTSMGKGGYEPGNSSINYWTMWGTYTVINHENPAMMSAGSYGVSPSSPNYYPPEAVYWSTKISTDGIYLHELNTTIWAQGHSNVSHGCLNLDTDNARWFYEHSKVGDIVEVAHTQRNAPMISFDQGGQWSVPWAQWVKGSALR